MDSVLLLAGRAAAADHRRIAARARKIIGNIVGWLSLAVGIAGMLFHLQSHSFDQQKPKNLVYAARFVAPLAYAGLGLLLIMDRVTDPDSTEWAQWSRSSPSAASPAISS